ncbi:MAG TPA: thiamine phosphate synthase [Gemmataceae bacterium]|nr:thiamine phosphate synthase [Gemmataceae bacterium]
MRLEYTPAVERALELAQQQAEQAGSAPTITDLFLALLEEEESRAAELLRRAGVQTEQARAAVCFQAISFGAMPTVTALLGQARAMALERSGERAVDSEHVMLALLGTNAIQAQLRAAGLDLGGLEDLFRAPSGSALQLEETLDLAEPPEWIETARIFDVNANRCREALRVIEDFCRFALNDAYLSREVKTFRHELVANLEQFTPIHLAEARDTTGDVGTAITTESEMERDSPQHIAQVNWKRLQEALRSLEEYSKCIRPELASALEQLRYRSYTLEKATVLAKHAQQRLQHARLYALLSASQCVASLEFVIAEAAAGGVDIIQLREKELDDRQLLERAHNVRRWTRQAGVLMIINDRPDIARLVEADGVHLGQDDMPVQNARRILGSTALIGVSTHGLDQVRRAVRDGASYIGIGPVFPSHTKSFDEFPGLEFVHQATAETCLPAFALGGITLDNVSAVLAAGAKRIAISSPICRADEPQPVAVAFRQMLAAIPLQSGT